MLLDSNILIYAAKDQSAQIETMVISGENAVASIVQIEVYGFPGLNPGRTSRRGVKGRSVAFSTGLTFRSILTRCTI